MSSMLTDDRSSAKGSPVASAAVELDHLMGSTSSRHSNVLHFLPTDANIMIIAVGAVVVLQEVENPHEQTLLRGHDSEVCAIAVCSSGRLLASGQLGSEKQKGQVAPVKVWSIPDKREILTLPGICGKCVGLSMSEDGIFLAAAGLNQMLIVWDISTGGEQVYARRTEQLCTILGLHLLASGEDVDGPRAMRAARTRHPRYVLCTAQDGLVMKHDLEFDMSQMSYILTTHKMQMPGHNLVRNYICGTITDGGRQLIAGTQQGEICIFNLDTMVFRSSLPCCNGSLRTLAMIGSSLYVAGGDGKIRAFEGSDTKWHVLAENALDPAAGKGADVLCLTPSPSGKELLAASANGKLWRVNARSLAACLLQSTVTGEVTCVSFCKGDSHHLMSGSSFGKLVVWDLGGLSYTATAQVKSRLECLCPGPAVDEAVCGYEDGFVRCWRTKPGDHSLLLWDIPNAHRTKVAAVACSSNYIVTGGGPGCCAVRVWHRSTRELLIQFQEHNPRLCPGGVAMVLVDVSAPHIVHSAGGDGQVVTYDLKAGKAQIKHISKGGMLTGMTQRLDSENELVTCHQDGRLMFWDIDYADPVASLHARVFGSYPPQPPRLQCVTISKDGRYIASGAEDGDIYIFDLKTSQQLPPASNNGESGHSGAIRSICWSPDGRQLATAARDQSLGLWNFYEIEEECEEVTDDGDERSRTAMEGC
ncbi:hypothetical protein FOL47_002471 [Perkinsus chesapeaki]|uniref:Guanine nucleotide-binding protein subunit beta-like protein n=1 Tax=Perkinsus chesapeaki TaxID=330153 RepID=A0A7J6MD56_PERCH|nr:hypothetical protein FOL47_002471 [Perkinsus chesapeaki]